MKKLLLSIPSPCHENWDEMLPAEKGKFCAACGKTVIDFSHMTDAQLAAFFRKPAGSVCGRFHNDQLQREIILPKKKLPWVRYFFQFTLPAFLLSLKAYSQGTPVQKQVVRATSELEDRSDQRRLMQFQKIQGQVTDSSGNAVPFATISIANSVKSAMADEKGNFEITVTEEDSTMIISAIGYELTDHRLDGSSYIAIKLNPVSVVLDPVIVAAYGTISCRFAVGGGVSYMVVEENPFQVIKKMLDTVFSNITIFPNPARGNSVINIKAGKLEKGSYLVTIFDGKATVVQMASVSFESSSDTVEMPIGNLARGSYLLHLRNKKSGKQYTKKLAVQ